MYPTLPPFHIRHRGVNLAVPPIHEDATASQIKDIVLLVLRRQYSAALTLAEDIAEYIERTGAPHQRLAALMGETPHKSRRGHDLAA